MNIKDLIVALSGYALAGLGKEEKPLYFRAGDALYQVDGLVLQLDTPPFDPDNTTYTGPTLRIVLTGNPDPLTTP